MKTYVEMDWLHRQDSPLQLNRQARWLVEAAKLEYLFAKEEAEKRAALLLHDRHVSWKAVAEAANRLVAEGFHVEYGLGLAICEFPGRPQEHREVISSMRREDYQENVPWWKASTLVACAYHGRPQAISLMRREDYEAEQMQRVRSAHWKASIAAVLAALIGIVALVSGHQLFGDISLGCSSILMFAGVGLVISMKERLERLKWRLDNDRKPVEKYPPDFILG